MVSVRDIFSGIVVETTTESWSGKYCYSDVCFSQAKNYYQHPLNELSRFFVIGMVAGVMRVAIAVFHILNHLFAALRTFDKGHLVHVAKGGCEVLRGLIEAIPVIGRLFAHAYCNGWNWWIIKIYNPNQPDSLDEYQSLWKHFKNDYPTAYCVVNDAIRMQSLA